MLPVFVIVQSVGSRALAKLVGTLVVTTHTIFVSGAWFLSFIGLDQPYYSASVGFSNVLFALKMVMCYELPGGVAHIFGYPVRMQTEMWFELLLNWLLLPQTSVTAHISGILAGFLYYEWSTLRPLDTVCQAGRGVVGSLPRWLTRPLGLDQAFRRPPGSPYRGGGVPLGGVDARHNRGGPRWSPTRPLVHNRWAGGQVQRATLGTRAAGTVHDARGNAADSRNGLVTLLRGGQTRLLSLLSRTRRLVTRMSRGGLGINPSAEAPVHGSRLLGSQPVHQWQQREQVQPQQEAQLQTQDSTERARDEVSAPTSNSPSLEELRQRRLQRFGDSSG